jgi:hypothetical protein
MAERLQGGTLTLGVMQPGSISLNNRSQKEQQWKQRVDMEERWTKRYQKVPSRDNPQHHRPLGQVATSCGAPHAHYPSRPPSEVSRSGGGARVQKEGAAQPALTLSSLPAPPARDGDDECSLSGRRSPSELSQASARSSGSSLPSTIRSSQPSTIARRKLEELQLRLKVERLKRHELETELENEKRLGGLIERNESTPAN